MDFSDLDTITKRLEEIRSSQAQSSETLNELRDRVRDLIPNFEFASSVWDEDEQAIDGEDIDIHSDSTDDLDEDSPLDEFHWVSRFQKLEVLNTQAVRSLMDSIEAGVFAAGLLAGEWQCPEILDTYSSAKIQEVIRIGEQAFSTMVNHNLKLVLHISRRFSRRVDLEEAFAYGCIGIIQAVKKYDWRLGHQFSTYATWWIRQSISREIADTSTTIGIPVHAVDKLNSYERDFRQYLSSEFTSGGEVTVTSALTGASKKLKSLNAVPFLFEIDSTLSSAIDASRDSLEFWDVYHECPELLEKYETPVFEMEEFEYYRDISNDLLFRFKDSLLSEREMEVLRCRYGIETGEPMTLDEIGKRYGLTRERIRQVESKLFSKIRSLVADIDLANYWDTIDLISERIEKSRPIAPDRTRAVYYQEVSKEVKSLKKASELAENLQSYNRERSLLAAEKKVEEVKAALKALDGESLPAIWIEIANLRIANPELSLSEIGKLCKPQVSKDVVSGTLRRLISRSGI